MIESKIESIIQQVSNDNLQNFFRQKISSFRSEITDLTDFIPEKGYEDFTQLVKLGEAEYKGQFWESSRNIHS